MTIVVGPTSYKTSNFEFLNSKFESRHSWNLKERFSTRSKIYDEKRPHSRRNSQVFVHINWRSYRLLINVHCAVRFHSEFAILC